jgi:uncharacterized protein
MRWTPGGRSPNLEDRRGSSAGGFGGLPMGGRGLGIGGFLILLVLSIVFKTDFFSILGGGGSGSRGVTYATPADASHDPKEEPMVEFVSFVLDDAQSTWSRVFAAQGMEYQPAKLVLFRDAVDSGCGFAQSATGPFYCPLDQKAYVDLGFYREMKDRFGAPGDFAQAYVLAHEIGHHVQHQLGIDEKVRAAQQRDRGSRNALSVRMELQADCFAGVWGHSTEQRQLLESGDVEEGLNAAAAIGDDRLQRMSGRSVSPESFTHGTSQQRSEWFRRGLQSGTIAACNSFE